MNEPRHIFDLSRDEWTEWFAAHGEPSYRADQLWHWMYQQLESDPHRITTLPKELRSDLARHFSFTGLEEVVHLRSEDGTEKVLLRLPDGQAIESVLMRYEDGRRTACISSQAGCALGCVFCATGQMGFRRHLSAGEIIEQVLYFARRLQASDDRLTNVVMMGMGEPFHNYEATLEALDRLNDGDGFNFGARRFTISTVGLVPAIERFADEGHQYNLAISLHTTDDERRSELMPVNRRFPLPRLMQACRYYVKKTNRRITFEWALVRGENDRLEHAERLADLLDGLLCHVNLIPLNPTQGYAAEATPQEQAEAFRGALVSSGIPATIRVRRGIDINAGCGQLATEHEEAAAG